MEVGTVVACNNGRSCCCGTVTGFSSPGCVEVSYHRIQGEPERRRILDDYVSWLLVLSPLDQLAEIDMVDTNDHSAVTRDHACD